MKPCPECGIIDGHKILCKTGNDRARKYQNNLEVRLRKGRKRRLKSKHGGYEYCSNFTPKPKVMRGVEGDVK